MAIKCVRECFWNNRHWKVGDIIDPRGLAYPHHFKDTDVPDAPLLLPQVQGGLAIIVGDVKGLEEEASVIPEDSTVFAVNRAGYRIQKVDYWVSYHTDLFTSWLDVRRRFGWPDPMLIGDGGQGPAHAISTAGKGTGGSAMYALDTAHMMGFDKFLIVGVHLLDEGYQRYRAAFRKSWPKGKNIRATGGWTKEFYGEPDAAWLAGETKTRKGKR